MPVRKRDVVQERVELFAEGLEKGLQWQGTGREGRTRNGKGLERRERARGDGKGPGVMGMMERRTRKGLEAVA